MSKTIDVTMSHDRVFSQDPGMCVQSDSSMIIAYERSTVAFGGVARLLLAAKMGSELVYVGG